MLFVPSIQFSCFFGLLLATAALAQRDCEKDGATSTYNQSGLIVPFNNLCGRDIEAALDFFASPEQRRSDCLDRCVRQVPLCYGFDYGPYVSSSQNNCWLMNGTFPASNATNRNFVADAAMLSPDFLARLPQNCRTLGLRGCFEQNGQLDFSTSSSAAPTASSSTQRLSATTTPTETPTGSVQRPGDSGGGLSTGAKAGIGAGIGLAALIAILSGLLFVLKRLKRRRAGAVTQVPSTEAQQTGHGDTYSQHKGESHIYAHMGTNSPGLAAFVPAKPAAETEQVHEIDGSARHEK